MKTQIAIFISLWFTATGLTETITQKEYEKLAFSGITQITIRTGGFCHRVPEEEFEILKTNRTEDIEKIIRLIELEKPEFEYPFPQNTQIGFNCMCCGDYTVSLLKNETEVFSFSIHHEEHFRSESLFGGNDVNLTELSIKKWKEFNKTLKQK